MGKGNKKGAKSPRGGRKMNSSANKSTKSQHRSKNLANAKMMTRFHDQIHSDLKGGVTLEIDPEIAGGGQHYCIPCARYFLDKAVLDTHKKTKLHKRRLKSMKEKPHTQDDANLFAGATRDLWWKS